MSTKDAFGSDNDAPAGLDERIFQLLLENPCQTKAQLQRRLGHSNPKKVNRALERLIGTGMIRAEGFWPIQDEEATRRPTAFVAITAPPVADTRQRVVEILEDFSEVGHWCRVSGAATGSRTGPADFVMILHVPHTDKQLSAFYDLLLAEDGVVPRTYWLIW